MAILLPLVAGYVIGKAAVYAYNNLISPQQKMRIKNKIKAHHFEYGVVTTAAGLATKSPTAVGTGISWIVDDWKDKDKAIENMKNKVNSAVNHVRKSLQTPNQGYRNRYYSNPRLRQMYSGIRY